MARCLVGVLVALGSLILTVVPTTAQQHQTAAELELQCRAIQQVEDDTAEDLVAQGLFESNPVVLAARGRSESLLSGKKLGEAARYVETVRGVGYRFSDKEL